MRAFFSILASVTVFMCAAQPQAAAGSDVVVTTEEMVVATDTQTDDSLYDSYGCKHSIRVKSNGIGWLMLVPNAAVEFDISRRLSLALPFYYSGWNFFSRTFKFRTATFQPEIRYWFSDCNKGWFVGAHFGIGYFNYALGKGHLRYQDEDRTHPAYGGGLAFGYRMPLQKNDDRWEMEFTLGAGVYSASYDTWENRAHGPRLEKGIHTTFFGIDQAAVTVSYRFDSKR